jgi:hypothetical protein
MPIAFLIFHIALMEDIEMHSTQLILSNIIYDGKRTLKKPFLKKTNNKKSIMKL